MRDGALWERATSGLRTSATASGSSLPTPVKYDTGGRGEGDNYHGLGWQARYVGDVTGPAGQYPKGYKPSEGQQMYPTPMTSGMESGGGSNSQLKYPLKEALIRDAEKRTWPTPVAYEDRAAKYTPETSFRHFDEGTHQVHLAQVVRDRRMWPTPIRSDAAVGKSEETRHPEYGELSPEWVEWLMGWPIGWTSIQPMGAEAMRAWEGLAGGMTRGDAEWWQADPSDDPQSGIGKTVPKPPTKKLEDLRQSRIAALGNGQVSAACATAFLALSEMGEPPEDTHQPRNDE